MSQIEIKKEIKITLSFEVENNNDYQEIVNMLEKDLAGLKLENIDFWEFIL